MEDITKIFVEKNGELINITSLPREEYEDFLESMHRLRIAYIATIRYFDKIKNNNYEKENNEK